ncbi:hypothetical protein HMPREF3190_00541 [Umbribacter vaginalis]|nr:hypothetical protein HMPREF3190_00541 [Coriobacteriales bacterium DNF00809]
MIANSLIGTPFIGTVLAGAVLAHCIVTIHRQRHKFSQTHVLSQLYCICRCSLSVRIRLGGRNVALF